MNSKFILFRATVGVVFLFLVGCAPVSTSLPATPTFIHPSSTPLPTNTIVPTFTATATVQPTSTPTATLSPTLTPTVTITPVYIGMSLPQTEQVIGAANQERLAKVAEWGRGYIQGVAFTPDGQSFAVGGAFGFAVYDMKNLSSPPRWQPFDTPAEYRQMFFSADGQYILLTGSQIEQVRNVSTGRIERAARHVTWLKPDAKGDGYGLEVKSPDKSQEFRSRLFFEFNEALFTEENTSREMYDGQGNLQYTLTDDIPYITYRDRVEPEGCDLGVFSPCGNALLSLAMSPGRVDFSPSGETFTVLYTVPSLWNSRSFSFLRVYHASNGKFIMSIGGRENPVVDFAYAPNSKTLGVAYMDGSVQLWDIGSSSARFGARHMNGYINILSYTPDSRYLVIQRRDELEVRQARDGAQLARFTATAFSISPDGTLVALGTQDGMIRVMRIDTGQREGSFQAHNDLVYSVAFSPDGRYIASGGRDCAIKLWDARTGQFLHHFEQTRIDAYEIDMKSRIFAYYMKFIPGTDTVIGFGSWGTAVAWSVNSGATKFIIQSAPLEYYNGMWTLKPHFPEFFDVDLANNRFYINEIGYDLQTGEEAGNLLPSGDVPDGCASSGPVSNDGKILFTRGYDAHEGEICILNAESKTLIRALNVVPSGARDYLVEWPFLSPDGKQLVVTLESGAIYVYQVIP